MFQFLPMNCLEHTHVSLMITAIQIHHEQNGNNPI